jgi:hypothetical protein
MTNINPHASGAQRRRSRSWIPRMLIAGLAAIGVTGALGLAAVPASAAMTCNGTVGSPSNLCLWIDGVGSGLYKIHVGIDVFMSFDRAQEYIDDPGNPFRVTICGDDGGGCDQPLFDLPLVALANGGDRLAGDFERIVSGLSLNEDSGQDEIRARVQLIDTDTNVIDATFVSNRITGNWP